MILKNIFVRGKDFLLSFLEKEKKFLCTILQIHYCKIRLFISFLQSQISNVYTASAEEHFPSTNYILRYVILLN